jgi:hypothetical protein
LDGIRFPTNNFCVRNSLETRNRGEIQGKTDGRRKKSVYNCIIASIGIEAAKQVLLEIPRKNNNNDIDDKSKEENHSRSYSVFYLSINNSYKNILRTGANAEEYYHVELKCNEDNGVEYGIQAYGEEAKEVYKEIHELIVAAIATSPRYFH